MKATADQVRGARIARAAAASQICAMSMTAHLHDEDDARRECLWESIFNAADDFINEQPAPSWWRQLSFRFGGFLGGC